MGKRIVCPEWTTIENLCKVETKGGTSYAENNAFKTEIAILST